MMSAPTTVLRARTRRVEGLDPWTTLQQAGHPRAAWNERGEAWLATGAVAVIETHGRHRFFEARRQAEALFARLEHESGDAPALARPRLIGGAAFQRDHAGTGVWEGFGSVRFWLPRRLVVWVDGVAWETTVESSEADPVPEGTDEPGPYSDHPIVWKGRAERVLRSMERLGVEKAVLARCERHATAPDPVDVLRRLPSLEPDTSRFLFDPVGAGAFVGATPERLVRVAGTRLETHALAGSTAGSGEALLAAQKEDREHDLVVRHIAQRLRVLGATEIAAGPRRLRRLRTVTHLETPFRARVENLHVLDAVDALYPTPAVAGVPEDRARLLLAAVEPFARGWYSGIVGWFDAYGGGSFSVALRCALIGADTSWLFAGAGLVEGSTAEAEWRETEAKLAPMRDALGSH